MQTVIQDKRSFWKSHIEKASQHSGGIRSYCKEVGISKDTLYFWRVKLSGHRRRARRPSSNPFLPAVIQAPVGEVPVTRRALPEPEWLAQFLSAMIRGDR